MRARCGVGQLYLLLATVHRLYPLLGTASPLYLLLFTGLPLASPLHQSDDSLPQAPLPQPQAEEVTPVVNYNCECGLRDISEEEERRCLESARLEDKHAQSDQRIVGGCDVGKMPWFVFILLKMNNIPFRCGGSLINKFWVLTAGHCVCNPQFTCVRVPTSSLQTHSHLVPTYNFTQHIQIMIGVGEYKIPNENPIGDFQYDDFVFRALEVIVHPFYKQMIENKVRTDYDFALIRLDYPVADAATGMGILKFGEFSRSTIMPICLPWAESFDDTNKPASAIGLGLKGEMSSCITNANGPEVFVKCADKWQLTYDDGRVILPKDFYYGRALSRKGKYNCEKNNPPPSNWDPVCKAFHKKIKVMQGKAEQEQPLAPDENNILREYNITKESLLIPTQSLMKKIANSSNTHCFSTDKDPHGWCVTCVNNATEGESGYCHPVRLQTETEAGVATSSTNWGFCHSTCSQTSMYSTRVKMVKLTTLTDELCQELGFRPGEGEDEADLVVNTKAELCGAFINSLNVSVFNYTKVNQDELNLTLVDLSKTKRTSSNTGFFRSRRIQLTDSDSSWDHISRKVLQDKNMVLGGQDTCSGDSGSPLFINLNTLKNNMKTNDTVAFLVGVVSRGRGCARKNYPGIYGRVKKILPWIRQFTFKPQIYTSKVIPEHIQVSRYFPNNPLYPNTTLKIYPYCSNLIVPSKQSLRKKPRIKGGVLKTNKKKKTTKTKSKNRKIRKKKKRRKLR